MAFHYKYFRDGKLYSFYYDDESPDTIRVVSENGQQKRLKVKPSFEWWLAGRKTFVYAYGGALGLFKDLWRCAKDEFHTISISMIIDDFKSGSKRWIAA